MRVLSVRWVVLVLVCGGFVGSAYAEEYMSGSGGGNTTGNIAAQDEVYKNYYVGMQLDDITGGGPLFHAYVGLNIRDTFGLFLSKDLSAQGRESGPFQFSTPNAIFVPLGLDVTMDGRVSATLGVGDPFGITGIGIAVPLNESEYAIDVTGSVKMGILEGYVRVHEEPGLYKLYKFIEGVAPWCISRGEC